MKKKEIKTETFRYRYMHAKSLQSCPTLYDPMDCSPAGSSIHGISQARILEWVAISFSNQSTMPQLFIIYPSIFINCLPALSYLS